LGCLVLKILGFWSVFFAMAGRFIFPCIVLLDFGYTRPRLSE
jgi:hypothetical protein